MDVLHNRKMLRESFQQELDSASREALDLGQEVGELLEVMAGAIETREPLTPGESPGRRARLKQRGAEIEERCLILQARQAPVARDLRLLGSVRAVAEHAVRAGALCEHTLQAFSGTEDGPWEKRPDDAIPEMARRAAWIFREALATFDSRDPDRGRRLQTEDDRVDLLYDRVMSSLASSGETVPCGRSVRTALAAHYLERIADHGVGIGACTVYLVTGEQRGETPGQHRRRRAR